MVIFMGLVAVLVFVYPPLAVLAVVAWTGAWRILAAIPLLVLLGVIANIIVGGMMDPTSHNLWPFEIAMVGGLGALSLFVLSVFRALTSAGEPTQPRRKRGSRRRREEP